MREAFSFTYIAKLIPQADKQPSEADDMAEVCGEAGEGMPRQPLSQTALHGALAFQCYRYKTYGV